MKTKNSNDLLEFHYPSITYTYFDWPWNCRGNWFLHQWAIKNKKNNAIWSGQRVFGFGSVTMTWLVSEEEAWIEYKTGLGKLMKVLKLKNFLDES